MSLAKSNLGTTSLLHKAVLFEKKTNKMVRCTACNNYCIIQDNHSGICGVRKNIDGILYLLVYGQPAAAAIDPIEKKPLYHVLPGERIFTIGTLGCNFGCEFCQNWDISQSSKKRPNEDEEQCSSRSNRTLLPDQIIALCKKEHIPAVAFSYNEPTIFFEYAYDTMVLAKQARIKTVFVSNGYESREALEKLKDLLDAINIDLKSFRDAFYKKHCHARLAPVLETIRACHRMGIWVEITTLLIPEENDSDEELESIASFIASIDKNIPWHISAFHPDYKMTQKKETSHKALIKAYEIGKKKLNHVYVGNIFDPARSATYCASCKRELIARKGYTIETKGMNLNKGTCKSCGERIAGIFK